MTLAELLTARNNLLRQYRMLMNGKVPLSVQTQAIFAVRLALVDWHIARARAWHGALS